MGEYLKTNSIELISGSSTRFFTGDFSNPSIFYMSSLSVEDWYKNYCRRDSWASVINLSIKGSFTIQRCPGEAATVCGTENPTQCGP